MPFLMSWSYLLLRFQGHDILQREITQIWHKAELYLKWQTNNKSYMIYQQVPLSMTLNDLNPDFNIIQH